MVAGAGNLLGGWGSGILIKRGCSITIARKSTVTFFAVLMLIGDSSRAGPRRMGLDRIDFDRHGRIHRRAVGHAELSIRRLSQKPGRDSLGPGQYGGWFRRNDFYADYRLGRGPLLVHTGVHRLRNPATDIGGNNMVSSGASSAASPSTESSDVSVEHLFQVRFTHCTDFLVHHFASLEHQERGNPANLVTARGLNV